MKTYEIYNTLRKVKELSKSTNISKKASWELKLLADHLEGKLNFMIKIGEEMKKINAINQVNSKGR